MSVNARKIAVCSFDSTKMAPKMKAQTFFGGHVVLIFLSLGKLGEIWAKMLPEVPWFEKNACVSLEVNFFGVFLGQVWGNFGKNSLQPRNSPAPLPQWVRKRWALCSNTAMCLVTGWLPLYHSICWVISCCFQFKSRTFASLFSYGSDVSRAKVFRAT